MGRPRTTAVSPDQPAHFLGYHTSSKPPSSPACKTFAGLIRRWCPQTKTDTQRKKLLTSSTAPSCNKRACNFLAVALYLV